MPPCFKTFYEIQQRARESMSDKPKYKTGDRLLAFVTVERSAHCDSVFVITDSKETAQLKESDIHSAVLLRFHVGDRVGLLDDGRVMPGVVKAVAYDCQPPQAWIKLDAEWPIRSVGISDLRRL